MALFSKTRRELRRKLRRPVRLTRRLRREVVRAVRLSRQNEKLRKEILDLAREAAEDKKALKELRNLSSDMTQGAVKNIDYFVKVFVDAEALVADVAVNISMRLSDALNRLGRSGFDKNKMEGFRVEFTKFSAELTKVREIIARLTRKAAKGMGGMSVHSTTHLQKQIRRAAKDLHSLRAKFGDLFDDLREKEEKLNVEGVESDLNALFEKINQELTDIRVVAFNNRILVARFKEAMKEFSSKIASARIADEQVKRILIKAARHIEAYEERALRQARIMARRQFRRGAAPARVISATREAA